MLRMRWLLLGTMLAGMLVGPCGDAARAGGGPENLFLVVNPRSFASITIANYFIRFRQVPSSNILYLDWDGSPDVTDVNTFRSKLLIPIRNAIDGRNLSDQIDYIIYSSDFPYRIDFTSDVPEAERNKGGNTGLAHPSGSLTGMTYLGDYVLARSAMYASLLSNAYVRRPAKDNIDAPSIGFHSWLGFGNGGKFDGQLLEAGGVRFQLSMMLGVTTGRGSTVDEVVNYLRRSAAADGTRPKGTVYFMKSDDVRSTCRAPQFEPALSLLKSVGSRGEIVEGVLPEKRSDVIGLMAGVASFDWSKSGSTILPGAICENLTSFGGVFARNDQTALTEFLRHGAAGACGTVIEPFAIPNKFPLFTIHAHYARGCSLAESFYQSVLAPYQQLIVGDPLCRPYARIPKISFSGVEAGQKVSGKISLKPLGQPTGESPVERFELFVGGVRYAACRTDETLDLDTTKLPDGFAELRVVGFEETPLETQGRAIVPVTIDNRHRQIEFKTASTAGVKSGQKLKLSARSPDSVGVAFYHNGQLLDKAAGASGEVEIDTLRLGYGPVTLTAIGWGSGGLENNVYAKPISFNIEP